jgi:hypothetical protein
MTAVTTLHRYVDGNLDGICPLTGYEKDLAILDVNNF